MGLFKRKKQEVPEYQTPCERGKHFYKDFPPYLIAEWIGHNSNDNIISIIEPYVCVLCGKRINKTLHEWRFGSLSYKLFDNTIEQIKKEYKDILRPVVYVEDLVTDAQLVDRVKLEAWEKFQSGTKEIQLLVPAKVKE